MEKILSIIIPSYNSKPFLAKCLDSLLCECTDKLDIIVVNDGSTDGCEKIAEEYIEKYPASISLINKENGGDGARRKDGRGKGCREISERAGRRRLVSYREYSAVYKGA